MNILQTSPWVQAEAFAKACDILGRDINHPDNYRTLLQIVSRAKSFEGHKGRPGKRGGSLPKGVVGYTKSKLESLIADNDAVIEFKNFADFKSDMQKTGAFREQIIPVLYHIPTGVLFAGGQSHLGTIDRLFPGTRRIADKFGDECVHFFLNMRTQPPVVMFDAGMTGSDIIGETKAVDRIYDVMDVLRNRGVPSDSDVSIEIALYPHEPPRTMKIKLKSIDALEQLSALEHDQWIAWSKDIAETGLAPERIERWQKLWIPYDDLNEEDKEKDREWARKVLEIVGNDVALKSFEGHKGRPGKRGGSLPKGVTRLPIFEYDKAGKAWIVDWYSDPNGVREQAAGSIYSTQDFAKKILENRYGADWEDQGYRIVKVIYNNMQKFTFVNRPKLRKTLGEKFTTGYEDLDAFMVDARKKHAASIERFVRLSAEVRALKQKVESYDRKFDDLEEMEQVFQQLNAKYVELSNSQYDADDELLMDCNKFLTEHKYIEMSNIRESSMVNIERMYTSRLSKSPNSPFFLYSENTGNAASRTIANWVLQDVPMTLSRHTLVYIFSEQSNANDNFFANAYKIPFFRSAACAGIDSQAIAFENRPMTTDTLVHEMAHNLATHLYQSVDPKEGSDYHAAMSNEFEPPVTSYAKVAPAEDFAEAVEMYVMDPENLQLKSPSRFKVIDKILREGVNYAG